MNGERPVGYKCYNQLNKGANRVTDKQSARFCDMPAICGWKLEMMVKAVFKKVWKDSELLEKAIKIFMNETVMEQKDIDRIRMSINWKLKSCPKKRNVLSKCG